MNLRHFNIDKKVPSINSDLNLKVKYCII